MPEWHLWPDWLLYLQEGMRIYMGGCGWGDQIPAGFLRGTTGRVQGENEIQEKPFPTSTHPMHSLVQALGALCSRGDHRGHRVQATLPPLHGPPENHHSPESPDVLWWFPDKTELRADSRSLCRKVTQQGSVYLQREINSQGNIQGCTLGSLRRGPWTGKGKTRI